MSPADVECTSSPSARLTMTRLDNDGAVGDPAMAAKIPLASVTSIRLRCSHPDLGVSRSSAVQISEANSVVSMVTESRHRSTVRDATGGAEWMLVGRDTCAGQHHSCPEQGDTRSSRVTARFLEPCR